MYWRETDRQTDRQRQRETETDRQRQTDRQTDTETEAEAQRHTESVGALSPVSHKGLYQDWVRERERFRTLDFEKELVRSAPEGA